MVNKEELENIARLSGLGFSDDYPRFLQDLSQMVLFADKIRAVSSDDFVEKQEITATSLRCDIAKPSADREEILKNAPCSQDGYFLLRKRA